MIVPIDFSGRSEEALRYAFSYAKRSETGVVLLHVITPHYGEGFLEKRHRMERQRDAKQEAERRLKEVLRAFEHVALPTKTWVRSGNPELEILKAAQQADAELIVIQRKSRGPISRMVFGSVTENLVDSSPVPVLVINN